MTVSDARVLSVLLRPITASRLVVWQLVLGLAIIVPFSGTILYLDTVSSSSLNPEIEKGQELVLFSLAYSFNPPARGDLVQFCFWTKAARTSGESVFRQVCVFARVIGLPGEVVNVCRGRVAINGRALREIYRLHDSRGNCSSIAVPPRELFVMADDGESLDADSLRLGPIPLTSVRGLAVLVATPLSKMRVLNLPDY